MKSNGASGRAAIWLLVSIVLFAAGLGAGYVIFSPGSGSDEQVVAEAGEAGLYTCGMHPEVIQEGPGLCPICNMDLTPIQSAKSGGSVGGGNEVVIDPTVVQNIGVRTATVTRGPLAKTIRATGEIVEDETGAGQINLKIAGWVEKLYVDETGQSVRRGDPLLELYSPKLITTQEEYLIALRNLERVSEGSSESARSAAEQALAATRRRLSYWDVPDKALDELERTREVGRTLVIESPFTGVVTQKAVVAGQRIVPGADLYHIADLRRVWIKASVFDADVPYVREGQSATVTLSHLPGREFVGSVSFVSPVIDTKTRDLKIRIEIDNESGELRPGTYGDVIIEAALDDDAVLIPSEAVIHSGKRKIVFIAKGDGRFAPTEVKLGPVGEGNVVQAIAGLSEGDEVVTSAQFLLDSESSFQEAIRKMMERPDRSHELAQKLDGHPPLLANDGAWTPPVAAKFEGTPVANAVSIEPDGKITIMCPVMKDTRIIESGDIHSDYNGQRVYYCCDGCREDFEADPQRYLAELDAAMRGED